MKYLIDISWSGEIFDSYRIKMSTLSSLWPFLLRVSSLPCTWADLAHLRSSTCMGSMEGRGVCPPATRHHGAPFPDPSSPAPWLGVCSFPQADWTVTWVEEPEGTLLKPLTSPGCWQQGTSIWVAVSSSGKWEENHSTSYSWAALENREHCLSSAPVWTPGNWSD